MNPLHDTVTHYHKPFPENKTLSNILSSAEKQIDSPFPILNRPSSNKHPEEFSIFVGISWDAVRTASCWVQFNAKSALGSATE